MEIIAASACYSKSEWTPARFVHKMTCMAIQTFKRFISRLKQTTHAQQTLKEYLKNWSKANTYECH